MAVSSRVVTLREVLTDLRNYYVSTTGSDSNDGLTSGNAFQTIQKALDVVATIDFNGNYVVVNVAAGTYTGTNTIPATVGQKTHDHLQIVGDLTTPSNVVVDTIAWSPCFLAQARAGATVKGFKLTGATNGYGLMTQGGAINFDKIEFGVMGQTHILCTTGEVYHFGGSYTISGSARAHILATAGWVQIDGATVTVTGTPAWELACVYASGGRIQYTNSTITGSATGARYWADMYGTIQTFGAASTFFPGDTAGSVTNGLYA